VPGWSQRLHSLPALWGVLWCARIKLHRARGAYVCVRARPCHHVYRTFIDTQRETGRQTNPGRRAGRRPGPQRPSTSSVLKWPSTSSVLKWNGLTPRGASYLWVYLDSECEKVRFWSPQAALRSLRALQLPSPYPALKHRRPSSAANSKQLSFSLMCRFDTPNDSADPRGRFVTLVYY
jgi:hypothetical protein